MGTQFVWRGKKLMWLTSLVISTIFTRTLFHFYLHSKKQLKHCRVIKFLFFKEQSNIFLAGRRPAKSCIKQILLIILMFQCFWHWSWSWRISLDILKPFYKFRTTVWFLNFVKKVYEETIFRYLFNCRKIELFKGATKL